MADQPTIEAVILSPLGEVRVWIDAGHATDRPAPVRTSIRMEYVGDREADPCAADLARVVAQLEQALKGLNGGRPLADTRRPPVAAWLAERCILAPGARTLSSDLYADFTIWAAANGFAHVMSTRAFADVLRSHNIGLAGKSATGLKYRGGVTLRSALALPSADTRRDPAGPGSLRAPSEGDDAPPEGREPPLQAVPATPGPALQ